MADAGTERRLTTILATDVVGYSRLMAADEAGTRGTGMTNSKSGAPSRATIDRLLEAIYPTLALMAGSF